MWLTRRCHHRRAAAVVVEPPSLLRSHHCCCGAAAIVRQRRRRQRQRGRRRRRRRKRRRSNYCAHTTTCSKNLLHQRSHHADKACAAQSHRPYTNLTQPRLRLILLLTRGIASLIKAQPLLKLNSTICRSCIFIFLPGLSHHLKRQPSVAPGGHAVCISYGILTDTNTSAVQLDRIVNF